MAACFLLASGCDTAEQQTSSPPVQSGEAVADVKSLPDDCESAKAYVEKHLDSIDLSYQSVREYPASYVREFFRAMSPEERVSLWRSHLETFVRHERIPEEERHILRQLAEEMSEDWFVEPWSDQLPNGVRIETLATSLGDLAPFVLEDIRYGPDEYEQRKASATEQLDVFEAFSSGNSSSAGECQCNVLATLNLGIGCTFGLGGDDCVSGGCGPPSFIGCGFFFGQSCNGRCGYVTFSMPGGGGDTGSGDPFPPSSGGGSCTYAIYVDGQYVKTCTACNRNALMICALGA